MDNFEANCVTIGAVVTLFGQILDLLGQFGALSGQFVAVLEGFNILSVTNSSYGLIFVKIRAKLRAKFKF